MHGTGGMANIDSGQRSMYKVILIINQAYNFKVDAVPTAKCKVSLEGHGGPVWSLAKKGNLLFSGSSDTTVQVWDMTTFKPTSTLTGHLSIVHSIDVWNKHVISGSDDRTIKVCTLAFGELSILIRLLVLG